MVLLGSSEGILLVVLLHGQRLLTQPTRDTTYSAGTGLDLTGTTFSIEPDLRDGVTRIGKDTSNYIAIGADTNVIDFMLVEFGLHEWNRMEICT